MSDSSVALRTNANIPETGSGGNSLFGGQSPVQAMDTIQQLRMRQTQVQTLQAQFAARQRAGQIIAAAPDFETGLTAIQKDPQIAGNAPDIIASLRGTQAIMTELQGKQLGQNRDAVQMVLQGAAGAMNDPGSLKALVTAGMQNLPPEVQKRVGPAMQSYVSALTSGLGPNDGQKYQQRVQGLLLGSGMGDGSVTSLMGRPTTVQQGDVITSALERPGVGVVPSGPQYGVGAAPRLEMVPQGNQTTPFLLSGQGSGSVGPSLSMGVAPRYEMTPVPGMPGATQPSIVGEGGIKPLGVAGNSLTGTGPDVRLGTGGPLGTSAAPGASAPRTATPGETTGMQEKARMDAEVAQGMQKAYAAHSGETIKSMDEDYGADAANITKAIPRFDNMVRAMSQFQAGGGADFRSHVGTIVQGFKNAGVDIDQGTIDKISNGSLSATQFFNANVKPLMVEQLKVAAQGTGRVMRSEVEAFMNAINATTDPAATMELLNQARQQLQIGYARANAWPDFRAKAMAGDASVGNFKPQDYPIWFANHVDLNKLPERTEGGIQLGPVRNEAARGAAPRTVPSIGEVVNGHRYRGGDPKDANSWIKVQ